MSSTINSAALFLITTLFDMYIFVLLIRIILVYVRADYYNPVSQIIIKLTQPLITLLQRFIPKYKTFELASIVLVLLLEMIKFLLLGILLIGMPKPMGLIILAIADAGKSLINIFFYAIVLQAILSWVNAGYSPIALILTKITTPILRPIQRVVPLVGGIDISPIPAMILLQLLIIILISPLFALGQGMAFG